MAKVALSPVQAALLGIADRERARRISNADAEIRAAHAMVGSCVEMILQEQKIEAPKEGRIRFDVGPDGTPIALVWDDKPAAEGEIPPANQMKEPADAPPSS